MQSRPEVNQQPGGKGPESDVPSRAFLLTASSLVMYTQKRTQPALSFLQPLRPPSMHGLKGEAATWSGSEGTSMIDSVKSEVQARHNGSAILAHLKRH